MTILAGSSFWHRKDGQDAETKGPYILVREMWVKLFCLPKVFVSPGYDLIGFV